MKLLKRPLSLIMTLIFALTLVQSVSFAEDKIPESYQNPGSMPYVGSNVPNCSLVYAGEENSVIKNWNSINPDRLYNASELAYSDGTFGKRQSDMVYLIRDSSITTRTDADLTQHGSYIVATFTQPTEGDIRTHDFVVEYSFAMTDTSDQIQVLTPMYQDYSLAAGGASKGSNGFRVTLSTTTVKFESTSIKLEKPLDLNKWYNACIVYDVEADSSGTTKEESYVYKLFINSELYATYNCSTKYYGPRYIRMGTSVVGNSSNTTPDNWVHYDNINAFPIELADNYVPDEPTASTLVNSDANIKIIEDTIDAPANYTVKNLKDAFTSSNPEDVIRFYNSDYSALAGDTDPAKGTKVVIASDETTFAYYSVERWIYNYSDLNKGGTALPTGGNEDSYIAQAIEQNGLGGKAAGDNYIRYADSSGDPYINVDMSPASGERDVFEMSVCVPEGANGISIAVAVFKDDTTDRMSVPIRIESNCIRLDFSQTKTVLQEWEPGTWHNIAIETPESNSGGGEDNRVRIYVDGALKREQAVTTSRKGFRHIRITGDIDNIEQASAYFDNIRVYSGTYEPKYDIKPVLQSSDYEINGDNVVFVTGPVTVDELKESLVLGDEDTVVRFYEDSAYLSPMSDGDYLEDGNIIVAATKNGTDVERSYNYYTIFKPKFTIDGMTSVNGVPDTLYNENDSLYASYKFVNNTTDITYTVVMYAAQYKYGQLINLWRDEKTVAPNNIDNLECEFDGIKDFENSSVKIMLVEKSTLYPFTETKKMRWRSADTPATLFLVGDSIVQYYEDPGYPIQGWGHYIGDYLNENITVDNRARSGWTTDHYLYPTGIYTRTDGVEEYGTELRRKNNADGTPGDIKVVSKKYEHYFWSSILPKIKAGDYVMISLGINDSGSGNVRKERYLENIETMYRDATGKGATVIFSTPTISGGKWNSTSSFGEGWGEYGRICMSFAGANDSVCLPLGATLVSEYKAMLAEYKEANPDATEVEAYNYVRGHFHMYEPIVQKPIDQGGFGYPDFTGDDSTHHNYKASNEVAGIIARLLKESGSSLGDYVK